jgi:hypothetical protein
MFLHTENQQLLWQTLQKTPYLVEFTQKFAGYRDAWFRGISEQFYTQWISQRGQVPTNARELLDLNKHALQFMVADLKRILGYSSPPVSEPSNYNDLQSYNVAVERKKREDSWSSMYNQYQSEYHQLLEPKPVPTRGLPIESAGDNKITNMEELVREHAKIRDMDMNPFTQPPTKNNTHPTSPQKLKIMDEIIEINIPDEIVKKTVQWSEDIN